MSVNQGSRGKSGFSLSAWVLLGAFALLVALTGGASRYDAIQIVPLRVLCALMLVPAVYYITLRELRRERVLLLLFGALVLLVAVQLVPLPPFAWQALPGREGIVRLDGALGLRDVWRPLTLTPMRTWNALGGMIVPAVAMLLAIALATPSRVLLHVVAAFGVLNATLSLLQVAGGSLSSLYFYEVTNRGGAVGIFANENHAAIFAACSLLVLTELGLRARSNRAAKWVRLVYPTAFSLILLAALVGGSRAGFAAALGAVLVSFGMLLCAPQMKRSHSSFDPIREWINQHSKFMSLLPLFVVFFTVSLFVLLGRSSAFNDLLQTDSFAGLRWSLWPVIVDMAQAHWLVGSGFGSFEQAYKMYEPAELLMPRYINQAHNDWVQLLIEGGVVAAALLAAIVLWIARAVGILAGKVQTRSTSLFWFGIFAVIGSASLIDYPLRTPLFQVISVWLLLSLSSDCRGHRAT